MAGFLTLQGSMEHEAELINGPQYLASAANESRCKNCGAALGGQDPRFCHVCKKVLCVCCSEMQEKLLFMRNDTKKTRGDNCPLCDLLRSISGEESAATATVQENSIPYQNHAEAKLPIPTETEADISQQVREKVYLGNSESENVLKVNSTVVPAKDGSKVGGENSLNTERSKVTETKDSSETDRADNNDGIFLVNSDVVSKQENKNEINSVETLDSDVNHVKVNSFHKGQGHLQERGQDDLRGVTLPQDGQERASVQSEQGSRLDKNIGKVQSEGSRMTQEKGQDSQSRMSVERGQVDQSETTVNKGQGDWSTSDRGQDERSRTTLNRGQDDGSRTVVNKGQDDQSRTTVNKGQGDQSRTTVDKGQGDQSRTPVDKSQGDQSRTTKDQGQDGQVQTKAADISENDRPSTTSVMGDCKQLSNPPAATTPETNNEVKIMSDKIVDTSTIKPGVQKHGSSVYEEKEVPGSDVLLQKEEQDISIKPNDKHLEDDKKEAEISSNDQNVKSSANTENTTVKKDKNVIRKPTKHFQSLRKENYELDSSAAVKNMSKLTEPNSAKQMPTNVVEEDESFDDEPEDVEYDNLRLKDRREASGILSMFGGMLGLGGSEEDELQQAPTGIKMAIISLTQPGEVTRQRDEYGRATISQRYRYRNILVVNTGSAIQSGSEGNSPGDIPALSAPDSVTHESISRPKLDPHNSNFPRLSKHTAKDNPFAISGDIPEGYGTGNFAGLDYEHFSNHKNEPYPVVSQSLGSLAGQTGNPDTLHSARPDTTSGHSTTPENEEGSPRLELGSSGTESKVRRSTSMVTQQRSKKRNRQGFTHTCSGCGRKDCEGNFMKLLREMIVTAGNAGFEIRNVVPDGNCMFAAIVDQLELKKDYSFSPKSLRYECLSFLRDNPESEDGTPYALFLDAETWEEYLSRMSQDGQWGDHMILQAISQVTKRSIQVIHHDAERDWTVIEYKEEKPDKTNSLFLGHVGELHYVSLRPSELVKQLHNRDEADSEEEFRSIDVFSSLPSLPNLDDPAKREMFEEDYFDPWSEIPALHLSYILKKFVPLVTTLQSADSMVANAEMMLEDDQLNTIKKRFGLGAASSVVLIGDAAEGLYAPYLNERERTEYDQGSEWVDVTGLVMPNTCIAYPKDHTDVGGMDAFIETEDVHPGYARLLARYPDQWGMASSEKSVMSCYLPSHHSNFKKFNVSKEEKDYSASQCLSTVSFFNNISMAIVAPFWPAVADEWRTRERKAEWPPPKIIDSIVSGGYHFECFPHPKSQNPDIEFHACFGVAEKMLAQEALSREQRYIYLVFKALCSQEFLEDDLITSAHLKSIFFYACEQLPCDIWVSRPGSCIFYLLDALFVCIQERNVPDYFLRANNLIDHFDEDQHKQILQKIMTLRNDPMTNLLKIGKKNRIYNAHGILGQVNSDIELFHNHHSARRSVLEALVPISINIAKYSIQTGAYKQALEQLQEAYEERLAISTCEDALPFTAFLTQATDGCTVEKQWWFFFVVDQQLHTTLCADLSMTMQPVALEELVGKDVAQTYVGTLIPSLMAHRLCRFCSDMAVHLFNSYHTQKCLPFLLFNLSRYREKRQRLALSDPQGQQQYFPGNMQPFISEDEDDFTDSNALRVFDQLYIVYNRLNQLWIFQDLLPEFESLCDIMNSRYAFTKLVTILKQMGLTERAQMAVAKRNSIPREATTSDYLDNSSYY